MKKRIAIIVHIIRRAVFVHAVLLVSLSIHFLSAFPSYLGTPVMAETSSTPLPDSPEALANPDDVFWDPRFGAAAPNARVYAIAIDSTGVYIGGEFTRVGNVAARGIAKWDGSAWSPVGGGVDGWVRTIEIYGGSIYVGGSFTSAGGVPCSDIARWDGTRWRPMGGGVTDPVTTPSVQDIAIFRGEVYIGGGFLKVGNVTACGIAKWNQTGWHALGSGVRWSTEPGLVFALAADSSYLYIGGRFHKAGGNNIPNLARWDGDEYMPIEGGAEVTRDVLCLAKSDGNLIVGGEFGVITPDYQYFNNLAAWDGAQWSDLNGGANYAVESLYFLGPDIYAAGKFTRIGETYARRVAKWDGAHWFQFGSGLQFEGNPSYVFAVAAKSDDELFVGGDFDIAGGKPSPHLARWFVSPPPNITARPDSIADSLQTGQVSSHALTIENIGGMVLGWNVVFTDTQGEASPLHEGRKPFSDSSTALSSLEDSTASLESHAWLSPATLPWARAVPPSGELYPGDSVAVQVLFDAFGLPEGEYDAILTVGSNHPDEPEILIPIHLDVAPAPDIALSDTALAFGVVAIGSSSRDTICVWNAGSETLQVLSISVDEPDFTVDKSAFNLLPNDSVTLEVAYTPTAEGAVTGDLAITCNDPYQGIVHVSLSAEGRLPVAVHVSPDSLVQTVYMGFTAVRTLSIDNIGPGPFDYLIAVRRPAAEDTIAAAIERTYELRRLLSELKKDSGRVGGGDNAGSVVRDLDGLRIMFDRSHGQEELSSRSIFIAGLIQLGATVTANTGPITSDVLDHYDVFWSTETFAAFADAEVHALADWIAAGGSMLLIGDDPNAISNYNRILSTLDAGIRYTSGGAKAGITRNIHPHETTHNVEIIYIDHPNAHLSTVSDPAVRLVDDADQTPIAAASVVGGGKIAAASEELFNDHSVEWVNNQLFGNQIMSWFVDGIRWLSVWPDSGSIAPAHSAGIEIRFDAVALPLGDYDAEVVILSTTWDSVMAVVPVRLHVAPIGDIALSDASLVFEPVYVGTQNSLSFTVYNVGNDTLSVDAISIDSPFFSTDTTGYLLAPNASIERTVTFHPLTHGIFTGTLTMTTNDPDAGIVSVALQGEGQRPPVMEIAIDSLYERLLPGEASLRPLDVANRGDAGLLFWVNIFEPRSGSPGSSLRRKSTPSTASSDPRASPDPRDGPQYDRSIPGSSIPAGIFKPEETGGALQDIAWVATAGSPFDSSTVFYENFEDTCFDGWMDAGGTSMKEVTGLTGASGTRCSYHEYESSPGHFNGIYRTFGAVRPAYVSFWIRSGDKSQNNAYFVFRDGSGREAIWFFAASNGAFYINAGTGGDQTYPYKPDTWYHIEFMNIDFGSKTFDYRVNNSLVKSGISFRNADSVQDIARLDLYNYSAKGEAWWDEILLSLTPHIDWARPDKQSGIIASEGALTLALTIDAANLSHGSYDAIVHVSTNMIANPTFEIPLHLDVDSALTRTLVLPLAAGWNTLGWNVDTEDDSLDSLFHSILDNMIIAHGFDGGGLAFSPAIPRGFNTLGSLDHYHGVCVKLSAPDTLVIHGKALSDQTPHVLSPGYNLMSYLPYQEDFIGHALASILPSLEHVLGYDGGVPSIYRPHGPPAENTLATMRPGSAYWFRLSEQATMVYPGLPVYPSTPPFMAAREQTHSGSSEVIPTTEWVNVWGDSVRIDDYPIQAGMTIRAIDADRIVCGEYVVHSEGSFGIMPVYRDNPYTPQDEGAQPGEFIILYFDSTPGSRVFVWHENGEIIRYNDLPVGQPEGQDRPLRLALHQNYPNPFNPVTTIEYELPEGTHVILAIYTIEGKLVKTLIDGPQPAGIMREIWDGRDTGGNPAASGIYFYRLQAGAAALTRKMVLIK